MNRSQTRPEIGEGGFETGSWAFRCRHPLFPLVRGVRREHLVRFFFNARTVDKTLKSRKKRFVLITADPPGNQRREHPMSDSGFSLVSVQLGGKSG
jgi:hypothetical protein